MKLLLEQQSLWSHPKFPGMVSSPFVCTLIIFVLYCLLPIVLALIHCTLLYLHSHLTETHYLLPIYIIYMIAYFSLHLRHHCHMSVTLR